VSGPDLAAVRQAVAAVPDPELPPVTIGMLGMVHDLAVTTAGHVEVVLLPTYSGCPATELIARDVTAALGTVPGVADVHVRFTFDPPWHAERIDEEGRRRLREFGISPPGGPLPPIPVPEGRPTLPVLTRPGSGDDAAPRPCPYCGSSDTTLDSAFGPTPCRDVRRCHACRQPFEAFKP
jgi:ring-1,2-phenylacetyl-CoA epoxidase subunit PaaD